MYFIVDVSRPPCVGHLNTGLHKVTHRLMNADIDDCGFVFV